MRVLWIITSHPQAQALFEQALALSRTGCEYIVRCASSLSQVPEAHLAHSGVAFVVDAFNPTHPGFEGLKKIRALGFSGHVFVSGEPSPETAEEAFKKYHLSGFFGSFDRIDYKLAGGLIHASFNYKDALDLKIFLEEGGRASEEDITNSKDFAHFVDTLGNFVSRFGISSAQIKKVLMGISLGHMKMGPTGPTFEGNFKIHFGLDKKKLVLSLRGLSKGCQPDMILSEFTEAILALGGNSVPRASMFPDMHHVVRSAHSLMVFSGNHEISEPAVDPMSLMTVISFPESVVNSEISAQWFAYAHVKKTEEMPQELAHLTLLTPNENEDIVTPGDGGAIEEMPSPRPIDEVDLKKILSDPVMMSDEPTPEANAEGAAFEEIQREPSIGGEESSADTAGEEIYEPNFDSEKIAEMVEELEQLRIVSHSMSEDVKRLMKERREPNTDRELREVKILLEEKNKKLIVDKKRVEDAMVLKDKEIQELKARIEELRMKTAA